MSVVDLNADVGEWDRFPPAGEAELMQVISSANVACGVHAGSAAAMAATVELALAHGVTIGAHPSLDDRPHFGRRELSVSPDEVFELVTSQIAVLATIAASRGGTLAHVKAHGALYNMAARDRGLAAAVAAAVAASEQPLTLVGLAGSELIAAGEQVGLRTVSEVFADRGYRPDGSLAPRSMPGAVIDDPVVVQARAVEMVQTGCVTSMDGTRIPVVAETICVHGDTPGAARLARAVRQALEAAGIAISARR